IKSGKLSQFVKELKQNDKPKAPKKGETARKDKPLAILMIQPWDRVAKQRVTQSFSPEIVIALPPLGDKDGTEGPMIIEAKIGGHFVHDKYGYIKNHKKTVKNGQTRTREMEEHKKSQRFKAKAKESQL
ncbi:hypothetical protein Tco_1416783, partial [Tanacetum coccineum]